MSDNAPVESTALWFRGIPHFLNRMRRWLRCLKEEGPPRNELSLFLLTSSLFWLCPLLFEEIQFVWSDILVSVKRDSAGHEPQNGFGQNSNGGSYSIHRYLDQIRRRTLKDVGEKTYTIILFWSFTSLRSSCLRVDMKEETRWDVRKNFQALTQYVCLEIKYKFYSGTSPVEDKGTWKGREARWMEKRGSQSENLSVAITCAN